MELAPWIQPFELELRILLRLVIAMLLSGAIGYERERGGKQAGMRTHMLVALGAAMFVSFNDLFTIASLPLAPPGPVGNFRVQMEPLSIVEAIVTGVSFLGAGTIFVSGRQGRVKGLTTAASIWVTAALGIAVGLERYVLATGSMVLILVILHLLSRFEPPQRDNGANGSPDQHSSQDQHSFKHPDTARPT